MRLRQHDLFWLDDICCEDVGLRLQGPVSFSAPHAKVDTLSVPGRNGDIHFFDGSYANISGSARCFALAQERVDLALSTIVGWCLAAPGYHRLSVSDEPDFYRLARISTGPKTEIRMRVLAPFELTFDCKPQRFSRLGEWPVLYKAPGRLRNPYMFASEPLVKITGSGPGTVQIGTYPVKILELDGHIMLDSRTQNAYRGTENKNTAIQAAEFPRLAPGENEIAWSGGVESVEITPHWWTL